MYADLTRNGEGLLLEIYSYIRCRYKVVIAWALFKKIIILIFAGLLSFPLSALAETSKNKLEIGFEVAELSQNNFDDLGPSNYTFFIGKKFDSLSLDDWAWRFSAINVDLSNEHLRNEDEVCCIDGDRSNLVGKLRQHRLYFDYLPYALSLNSVKNVLKFELIPSVGFGYNNWVTKDIVANEEHNVRALVLSSLLRAKVTIYDGFFIEIPVDVSYIAAKNKNINNTVGTAVLDRSEQFSLSLLFNVGYRFEF